MAHRIDTPRATVGGLFDPGDPGVGVRPTALDADWCNMVQEEIVQVILAAGIALAKGTNTQLLAALQALIAAQAWTPANDGSGSGLNADLLDGYESTAFERITGSSLIANGGYIEHANGLKECWGQVTISADSVGYFNLPVAHTSWCVPTVNPVANESDLDWAANLGAVAVMGTPPNQIKLWNSRNSSASIWVRTIGV